MMKSRKVRLLKPQTELSLAAHARSEVVMVGGGVRFTDADLALEAFPFFLISNCNLYR